MASSAGRAASLLLFLAACAALMAEFTGQAAPSTQDCQNYQQQVEGQHNDCTLGCATFASGQCQQTCTNQYVNNLRTGCQQGCTDLCYSAGGPATPGTSSPTAPGSNANTVSLVTKPGDVVVNTFLALGHVNLYCLGPKSAGLPLDQMNVSGSGDLFQLSGTRIGNYTFDFTGKTTYLLRGGVSVTNASAPFAAYGAKQTSFNKTGCYFSLGDYWEATNGLINNTLITYITATNTTGGLPPVGTTCPPYVFPAQFNGDPSYVWSIPYQSTFTFYSKYAPPPPPAEG